MTLDEADAGTTASASSGTAGIPTVFFLHVMKTSGATLRWQLRRSVDKLQMYPNEDLDGDLQEANFSAQRLIECPASRRNDLRVICAHVPAYVLDFWPNAISTTMVRHPVERTVSFLRHARLHHTGQQDFTLDELYDDVYNQQCFIRNHQTKVFSLAPSENDPHPTVLSGRVLSETDLSDAKARLAEIDVVGTVEDRAGLVTRLGAVFPLDERPMKPMRVNEDIDEQPTPALLDRIRSENGLDMELYEYAVRLTERDQAAKS